jgi:hypothetical protein
LIKDHTTAFEDKSRREGRVQTPARKGEKIFSFGYFFVAILADFAILENVRGGLDSSQGGSRKKELINVCLDF